MVKYKLTGKKCPICGLGKVEKIWGAEQFKYKDNILTIYNFLTLNCNVCQEAWYDNYHMELSSPFIKCLFRLAEELPEYIKIHIFAEIVEDRIEFLGGKIKFYGAELEVKYNLTGVTCSNCNKESNLYIQPDKYRSKYICLGCLNKIYEAREYLASTMNKFESL